MAVRLLSNQNVNGDIDVNHSQNAITYVAVTNTNTGVAANSRVQVVGESAQLDMIATSAGYTGVTGWADAGIITTDSGASGGLKLNSQAGGIQLQIGTTSHFYLATTGNVGINDAGAAATSLSVKDTQDSTFTSGISVIRSANSDVGYINMVGGAFNLNSTKNTKLRVSDTTKLEVRSSGINVIGETETDTLNCTGTGTFGGAVRINATTTTGLVIASSSGASSGLKLYNNSTTDNAYIYNHFDGNLEIGTNNATVLTMNGTSSTFAGQVTTSQPNSGLAYPILIGVGSSGSGVIGYQTRAQFKDIHNIAFNIDAANSGSAQWVKVGTLTNFAQSGYTFVLTFYGHTGYNASNDQDYNFKLFLKTSNGSSTGSSGAMFNTWVENTGKNGASPALKWINTNGSGTPTVGGTGYELYMNVPQYVSGSIYTVDKHSGNWTSNNTLSQSDPGNDSSTVLQAQNVFNILNTNVGIGVTDPEKKLEVKSDTTYDGILIDTLSAPEINFRDRGNSDTLVGTGRHALDGFHIDTYSGNAFFIKGSNRYVGIGTTTPDMKLDVAGNIRARVAGNVAGGFYIGEGDTSEAFGLLSQGANGYFKIRDEYNSADRFYISHTGNVGIGTTTPGQKLEVAGRIRVTTDPTLEVYEASNKRGGFQWDSTNDWVNIFSTGGDMRFDLGGEKMRINSSGNVGINETSPRTKLEIKVVTSSRTTVTRALTLNANGAGLQPYEPFGTGIIFEGFDYAGGGGTSTSRDYAYIDARIETSGSTPVDFTSRLVFATNSGGTSTTTPTTKMVIKGDGNVGIGTTSPTAKLEIVTAVGADAIRMNYGQSADIFLGFSSANPRILLQDNSNVVTHNFVSNGDNYIVGSNVGIGTTSPAYGLDVRRSNGAQFYHEVTTESTANIRCRHEGAETTSDRATQISFRDDGDNEVGSIKSSGSATFYNTSSDYRLKQNEKDFNGLDLVDNIKVYDFEWKKDGGKDYGVFAHELQEVVPEAVSGEKDGEEMQGVDYSRLVPILLKSIQELKAEIEELKKNK